MSDALKPAKHGRDHCPGGIDPIPCWPAAPKRFRARRKTTFQTLGAGGTETDLEWNFWENEDDTVWQAQNAAGSVETTTTNPIRSVVLLQPALVVLSGCISVQALASGQLVIVINDGYDNPEIVVQPAQVAGSGGDYVFTKMASYPVFDPTDDPDGEAEFSIDAAQNSGIDRATRFGTYWELAAWLL